MASEEVFFEQICSSGCLSYILGCKQDHVCVGIDPEINKVDDYVELARFFGSTVQYAIDTHTHADHNSAQSNARALRYTGRHAPSHISPAPENPRGPRMEPHTDPGNAERDRRRDLDLGLNVRKSSSSPSFRFAL
jgi:glyoxylase-like metal-dependent hydrolase (beta-lactamase superfamily II)